MDSQIITCLFNDVIEAQEILDTDHAFGKRLRAILDRLPQPEVGKYGQIKEWAIDYDEAEPGHVLAFLIQLYAVMVLEVFVKEWR